MKYSLWIIDAQISGDKPIDERLLSVTQVRHRFITGSGLLKKTAHLPALQYLRPSASHRVLLIELRRSGDDESDNALISCFAWLYHDGRLTRPSPKLNHGSPLSPAYWR